VLQHAPCNMQFRRFKASTTRKPDMVDNLTITVDIPESIEQEAKEEAEYGNTAVEDQIIDRLRITWESDPRL
jgi:hypothetical protein